MKAIYIISIILGAIFLLAFPYAAFGQKDGNRFESPEAAIEKAKSDFLEVLRQGYDFNFGVKADDLASAKPGNLIPYMTMDFDGLLQVDQEVPPEKLAKEKVKTIAPMMNGQQVVTTFELRQEGNAWMVSGLGDAALTQNLNQARRAANGNQTTLLWVPNLNVMIYAIGNPRQGTTYLTNYREFTMRKAVDPAVLMEVLSADARRFQEEFGDQVKEQRLVD